tara:strand:- start:2283 stop:4517 length:2235 start_codon:yes stop_codon:yes gene_type:complete
MNFHSLYQELKRRNVFRVATAYAIAGWLIIQICATTIPFLNLPEWLITAVILFVLIGFPLALIFAWAFELTPEGIQKSKEVDITESVTAATGKKLNGVIIAVLSIALFFVVTERIFFATSGMVEVDDLEIDQVSIAVLPFVNMSGDEDNEYFSDGLSEELLNGLAKLEDLQVAGRTSSFQFKGTNPDLRNVGTVLGVKHILEGSVRKSGNRVRITAQLIQTDNGFHLWSETYDREISADEIFNIQEEITRKVIDELKIHLLPDEEIVLAVRPTEDIEAYNAYLEATQLKYSTKVDDIEKSIQKYKEAIRLDPTFAEAYAGIANTYIELHFLGNLSLDEAQDLVRKNADQALLMNSDLAEAYVALASYYELTRDFDNYDIAIKKAYDISPNNPELIARYGRTLDDVEESSQFLVKAYTLDPINPRLANYYAYDILMIKEDKFEEALKILDDMIERYPEYTPSYSNKAFILRDSPYGELDKAFEFLYKGWKKDPENIVFINELSEVARDVEFYEYADYLSELTKEMYPDNWNWRYQKLRNSYFQENYSKALEIYSEIVDVFNLEDDEYAKEFEARLNYYLGEFESISDIYLETYPEMLEENYKVDINNDILVLQVASTLKKGGNIELANRLIEKACAFTTEQLENLPEGEEPYSKLFDHVKCLAASGQFEEAAKNLEILHFDQGSKANWPGILSTEAYFDDFKDSPEFAEVKAKVFRDLYSMRSNIIAFLRAEGEWREEWEVGNSK